MTKNRVIDYSIKFITGDWQGSGVDAALIKKAIIAALEANGNNENNNLALAVVLADDKFIQDHNREFRSKDKPTNVLAFRQIPMLGNQQEFSWPESEPTELGDIIVAYETVCREAKEACISFNQHFSHLLIHGVLQLLGYEHDNDEDAEIMQSAEVSALTLIGYPSPYQNEI